MTEVFKILLLFSVLGLVYHAHGVPFSFTITTLAPSAQMAIPLGETVPSFSITIDWGDGMGPMQFYSGTADSLTGTYGLFSSYATVGTYTIVINAVGTPVTRLGWNIDHPTSGWSAFPNVKLVNINSFGDFGLTSLRGFLCRTSDNPTLPPALPSTVTDLSGFFFEAPSVTQSVSSWVVSKVTNMERMFYGAKKFNQPLDTWNVAAVTNMSGMFNQAQLFNQALSSWNVASVTDMSYMFFGASAFVQSLAGWNVAAVTSMEGMFSSMSFNSAIGTWNTKSVTKMARMFESNPAFNQDLSLWNVTRVVDMTAMFNQATAFYQNLTSWCLPLIFSEPSQFATGSGIIAAGKPNWGCLPPPATPPVQPPALAPVQVPVDAPVQSPVESSVNAPVQSPVAPATACTGAAPPGNSSCVNGHWVIYLNASEIKNSTEITVPSGIIVIVVGNVTLENVTFTFPNAGSAGRVEFTDCVILEGEIRLIVPQSAGITNGQRILVATSNRTDCFNPNLNSLVETQRSSCEGNLTADTSLESQSTSTSLYVIFTISAPSPDCQLGNNSDPVSPGLIAGVTIVAIVVVSAVAGGIFIWRKRWYDRQAKLAQKRLAEAKL